MPERAPKPDAVEQATALFWNPPTLAELVADLKPLGPEETFDIPDMTDAEWDDSVATLSE